MVLVRVGKYAPIPPNRSHIAAFEIWCDRRVPALYLKENPRKLTSPPKANPMGRPAICKDNKSVRRRGKQLDPQKSERPASLATYRNQLGDILCPPKTLQYVR